MSKVEELRKDIADVEAQLKEYQKNKFDVLPTVMVAFHARLAQLYTMLDAELGREEYLYYHSCVSEEQQHD